MRISSKSVFSAKEMLSVSHLCMCEPSDFADRTLPPPISLTINTIPESLKWWREESNEEERSRVHRFLDGQEIILEGCSLRFVVPDNACSDSDEAVLDYLLNFDKNLDAASKVNDLDVHVEIVRDSIRASCKHRRFFRGMEDSRKFYVDFSLKVRLVHPLKDIPPAYLSRPLWMSHLSGSLGPYARLRIVKAFVSEEGVYIGGDYDFIAKKPCTDTDRNMIFRSEMKLEKDLVNFASLLKLGSDFAADAGDRLALSSGLANFKFKYRGPMTYIFMLFGQDSAPIGRGPNLSTTEVNVCLPQLTEGPHSIVHGMREVANYCTRSVDQWIASGVMKHMSIESGGTRVAVRTAVQYGVMAGKTFDEVVEFLRNLCAFLNAYANFLESIMGAVRNHSRSDSTIVRNLCGLIAQAMKVSPADYLDYEVEPIRKLAYWYVVGAV